MKWLCTWGILFRHGIARAGRGQRKEAPDRMNPVCDCYEPRLNVELYPASILRSPSSYLVLVTMPLPFYRHLVT